MGLRLLATISGDDNLIADFLGGADVHASTARRVLGLAQVIQVVSRHQLSVSQVNPACLLSVLY
jgi:DNA polymerase I-like protein with 3'-5' exonuclease and polymerase domains